MTVIILFGTMIVLLITGVPISVSLRVAAVASLLHFDVPMAMVPQRISTAPDSVSIMAIPPPVLARNLTTESGIPRRLVDFCNNIIGGIQGGTGYVMVLACAFSAALSDSAPATVLAIDEILHSDMACLGYPKEWCAGLPAVSGRLDLIIPSSITMVVYRTITSNSVGDMLRGEVVAGLMVSTVLMVICIYYSNKERWPENTERTSVSQLARHFVHAPLAPFLPFVILGGVYSRLTTPTESATVVVIYSSIVSVFVYRELHPRDVCRILPASGKGSTVTLFTITTPTVSSWLFTFSGMSGQLVDAITVVDPAPWMFCLIIALVLLVFGAFLEGVAICVFLMLVLWSIAQTLEIGIIHFGMIMCIVDAIGRMAPPVAINLFTAASVSKLRMSDMAKGKLPFFLGYTAVFFPIVLAPALSMLLL